MEDLTSTLETMSVNYQMEQCLVIHCGIQHIPLEKGLTGYNINVYIYTTSFRELLLCGLEKLLYTVLFMRISTLWAMLECILHFSHSVKNGATFLE